MPQQNPTRIALLRAVNVGGRTVTMERLRAIVAEEGFGDVATFIASGNVIFRAPEGSDAAIEARLERRFADSLGWAAETFVRRPAELAAAAAARPFGDEAFPTMHVCFLKAAPDAGAVARLAALRTDYDEFAVVGREAYWACRGRSSDSKITGKMLERAIGQNTARSVTTVGKLAVKYAERRGPA